MIRLQSKYILASLFCLSLSWLSAGDVHLTGKADAYKGSTIFALKYSDIYTQTLSKVAESKIDENGFFSMHIPCEETEFIQLRFNYLNAKLWIDPGKKYDLEILPLPEGTSISINNKTNVPYTFSALDEDDINFKILAFNYEFDHFLANNYNLIQTMVAPQSSHFQREIKGDSVNVLRNERAKSSRQIFIDSLARFEASISQQIPSLGHTYFKVYRNMSIANYLVNSGQKDRLVFEKYIENRKKHFSNTQYHRFLKGFFASYFANFTDKWGDSGLANAINKGTLNDVRNVLAKDDFVADKELLDFVIVHAIYEVQNNRALNRANMKEILSQMTQSAHSNAVKAMASAALNKMTKTEKGYAAYDFSLPNEEKELMKLSDFKGKYVLINFWANWCSSCKKEMSLIQKLQNDYSKHFNFISINLDEFDNLENFKKQNGNLAWPFLHGNDPLLAEAYNVFSLPSFVLIDKEGKFNNAYTKKPSEGLEETIFSLFQKEELALRNKRKTGKK